MRICKEFNKREEGGGGVVVSNWKVIKGKFETEFDGKFNNENSCSSLVLLSTIKNRPTIHVCNKFLIN
jgi:hypothetical protein